MLKKLKQYAKKRDFSKTNEPKPNMSKNAKEKKDTKRKSNNLEKLLPKKNILKKTKIKSDKKSKDNITQNVKRFVIQHHFASHEHFDFRLENKGVLLSFAVPKGMPKKVGEKRLAIMVEDHPLDYINFSGQIPSGQYGAGSVTIWDSGTYAPLEKIDDGIKKGNIKILLFGKKTKGVFNMIKMDDKNWLLIKDKKII